MCEFILRPKLPRPVGQCLLSFDDGPAGPVTERLLAVLRMLRVKACFCLVGQQIEKRPSQAQAIARDGHLLVNHTYRHHVRDLFSELALRRELAKCDAALGGLLQDSSDLSRWFRPPFGVVTAAVRALGKERNILPITHFGFDPMFNGRALPAPAQWMRTDALRRQGGIYVLHDGLIGDWRGSWDRSWVPAAVESFVRASRAAGLTFPEPEEYLRRISFFGGER